MSRSLSIYLKKFVPEEEYRKTIGKCVDEFFGVPLTQTCFNLEEDPTFKRVITRYTYHKHGATICEEEETLMNEDGIRTRFFICSDVFINKEDPVEKVAQKIFEFHPRMQRKQD